ncbi:MAG TPA: STAS domain-containing protein [Streptosporangiaceae bacterium]
MERNKALSRSIVVTLPDEIDMTNADQVAATLHDAFAPGVRVVIADLTTTTFCDSAGIRELTLVHSRAAEAGSRLHLAVVPGGPVSRVLELMDLTGVLNVYPSVEAAAATDAGR